MKKRQALIVLVLLAALVGAGEWLGRQAKRLEITTPILPPGQIIRYQGETGKNVLELLKRDHQVETRASSLGTDVTKINGVSETEEGDWVYTVDGEEGFIAPDEIITENGQVIEWQYITF